MKTSLFPRLMIAGTHSGVGKTTVTMGILAALSKEKKVQPYKVGPDYIDPAYHTFITGRKSRNMDSWMLSEDTLLQLFKKNMEGAEIGIIEGVMGLFDGAEVGKDEGSTAGVAKILNAPVVLVVDGSGMSTSAAAMVKGYGELDPRVRLEGVIFNKVSGDVHYQLLKEAVETYTRVKAYGYLPKNLDITLPSRHLGLIPSGEIAGLSEKIETLRTEIQETIDVEGLWNLAKRWEEPLPESSYALPIIQKEKKVPIGVAYDSAFHFYYWDHLELLEQLGAELHFFSPIKDRKLPPSIQGLYIGGGFPEMFATELADNKAMRQDIFEKLQKGMPYLAECGGLMYLNESLSDLEGNPYPMVGWLSGKSHMTSRLQRFGYATLFLREDCLVGKKGEQIRVHEFHRSVVELEDIPMFYRLEKHRKGSITKRWTCGYGKENGIAGYAHFHFYSNPQFAMNFVDKVLQYKN